MHNRILPEQIKAIITKIGDSAAELYELLPPGMSIEIYFPETPTIEIPGQAPKVGCLIITRPSINVQISANPATEGGNP